MHALRAERWSQFRRQAYGAGSSGWTRAESDEPQASCSKPETAWEHWTISATGSSVKPREVRSSRRSLPVMD
jgi:hypothetical protein